MTEKFRTVTARLIVCKNPYAQWSAIALKCPECGASMMIHSAGPDNDACVRGCRAIAALVADRQIKVACECGVMLFVSRRLIQVA